jgi:ferric-dicitrate binding protein FerR (iron transport regulator)
MNEENIYHLAEVIVRYLKNRATPRELQELDDWKNASPDHALLLQKFSDRAFLEQRRIAEILCDHKAAYRQFAARQRRYRLRRKIAYTLAGTAAAILLAAGIFFTRERPAPLPPRLLAAGESRALLTLGDGQQIHLGNGQQTPLLQENGITQDTTGNHIAYQPEANKHATVEHRIDVPRKGEYNVILSDSTRVWLNSESHLWFPSRFTGDERRVRLEGEAYFEVRADARHPFIIEANNTTVRVLGTSFNVRAYPDETRIVTTLQTGSVRLSLGERQLVLHPDEQGLVDLATREMKKRPVEARLYTSWKEGRFIFEGESLEEIMNTLRRWYDVNIFFDNEAARKATFNGNIERYEDFYKIIELLEMTGTARFTVEENNIHIR